jgi:hypothetical protein
MQFVANGPDIPETLLQAHEEGRVVFFCGAGISYPAGLPGFKGLVDRIYKLAGTKRDDVESEAYRKQKYDATLDLLERRLHGPSLRVRRALVETLKPKLKRKGATDTHTALLRLAHNRKGTLRLVTTNFDRIFEVVAKSEAISTKAFVAPMLPIPKVSRWDGVVYLHGLLSEAPDDAELRRLVVTSGDFGLAYLTERWAARFVTELFRNYVVCFVGYTINDPVLRYMMDALAADRMRGESTLLAYAFGDCDYGSERNKTFEWEAKGVTPILYDRANGHIALHRTLKAWAETWRDGVLGKEKIVVDYAIARPSASTNQDNFVGRMLWALSHESGLPAKRFAEFNPVPSLDWLEAFSDNRYQYSDLIRFGITPVGPEDKKLRFSLVARPSPYAHASWMCLVSERDSASSWDSVMFHLGRWLIRHLGDPELIRWLSERGCFLNGRLAAFIDHRLDEIARLEREGKTAELREISIHSPKAVPSAHMRILWRILLAGRVKSPYDDMKLFRWGDRFKRDGLTPSVRLELRELLAPKVIFSKPYPWNTDDSIEEPERIRQLVNWELVLASVHVHSFFRDFKDERWQNALVDLVDDLQQLLRDALDLEREVNATDSYSDRSHWDLPSISDHWQNRDFRDWVILIELLRDAWVATYQANLERADQLARSWFQSPYVAFKRLALFAASMNGLLESELWVDWLLDNENRFLWVAETRRETMRLLVLQGNNLSQSARDRLEAAILKGPPRPMDREDIEADAWQWKLERSIWLHLAKLKEGGANLGDSAAEHFEALSLAHSKWKLENHDKDEFSHWMSGSGDPDAKDNEFVDVAPRKWRELAKWLKREVTVRTPIYEDPWRLTCGKHPLNCLFALRELAQVDDWPTSRWGQALHAWSEKGKAVRMWRYAAPVVQSMPDNILLLNASAVAWWLESVSELINDRDSIFFDLCGRILSQPFEPADDSDEPITDAINHAVGHVTQALLNIWFRRKPNDNEGLPSDIRPFFQRIADSRVSHFRHGRVLLASQIIGLFRVDREWTEIHFLPLFDWSKSAVEARAVWEGFLWSPRLYRPLLIAFKPHFLESSKHYAGLGGNRRQFAAFLTYVSLERIEGYSDGDLQKAIGNLPADGLIEIAQALAQSIEGAGEQREESWKNRIYPFWLRIWPKSIELASEGISESFARICIAAGAEFPNALDTLRDWLRPLGYPDFVVKRLKEADLVSKFPAEVLKLLSVIILNPNWVSKEWDEYLDAIIAASPTLKQDPNLVRIRELIRQRGH